MGKEWFRVAKDVDRLRQNQLKPVSEKITPLFTKKKGPKRKK
jgi:hypothetical protein